MDPEIVSSTTELSTTVAYTLTSGDVVIYHRMVTAGDILIASGLWALCIFAVVMSVYLVAKGKL